MNKTIMTFTLLTIVILLSACAGGSSQSQPVVVEPQAWPTPTAVEKVVTLIPAGEQPAASEQDLPPTPVRSGVDAESQETAMANIRALLGAPDLELAFQNLEPSPNATNHPAVLFVDPQGNRFYVSPATLKPVEFTVERPVQDVKGSPKTEEELRAIAFGLAGSQSTRFARLQEKLVYSEGGKVENFFFRWEMPGTDVGGMPALLQVGLLEDGTLFAFINSLDYLP